MWNSDASYATAREQCGCHAYSIGRSSHRAASTTKSGSCRNYIGKAVKNEDNRLVKRSRRRNFSQKGQRYEQKTHLGCAISEDIHLPSVHAILNCTPFAIFDSPGWPRINEMWWSQLVLIFIDTSRSRIPPNRIEDGELTPRKLSLVVLSKASVIPLTSSSNHVPFSRSGLLHI